MERYMILLKPGGKCRLIPCDKDGTLTLQAMQVLVDGPIETADKHPRPLLGAGAGGQH